MNRRESIQTLGLAAAGALMIPGMKSCATPTSEQNQETKTQFKFCLNMSTIRGQQQGMVKDIETAAEAGYDSIEIWMRDIIAFTQTEGTLQDLNNIIKDNGLEVASCIGFAPWMSDIDEVSRMGFEQMKEEMEILAQLDCKRVAAPPAGEFSDGPLDLFLAGRRYAALLDLGRQTGVMPQLEFWGASSVLWHMGQILMIAGVANDPDARLLPDIYHLFRGDSGFESLNLLGKNVIEIFHMNDYPGDIPRTEQKDADRVYPGDGVGPVQQVVDELATKGGTIHLSLELFNPNYYQQDALSVAKTGLEKMKQFV